MATSKLPIAALGAAICLPFLTLSVGCGGAPDTLARPDVVPPLTRTVDASDNYHGTVVADPYRWLEDQDSPEVLEWADSQNVYTEAHIRLAGTREELRERLTALWNYERYSAPSRYGELWFYSKNDGLQNQSVIYCTDDPAQPGRVLIDPNTFSEDGTVALGGRSTSKNGRYVAYATSASGSDWRDWQVLDVASGRTLDDKLTWTKFTGASWTHDEAGFFYQRYPAPKSGEVYEASNTSPQLCYHRVGTAQSEDAVVYERPDKPNWSFGTSVTDDGRYAVISMREGTDPRNRIAWLDLEDRDAGVKPLIMEFDASYDFVGSSDRTLFFTTDLDAPNERLIAVDLDNPARDAWRELIPTNAVNKLASVRLLGGQFVALYLENARHRMFRFTLEGEEIGEVKLPGIGSVAGISGKPKDSKMFFGFHGFTRPLSIYSFDLATGKRELWREPKLNFDPDAFETRSVALQSQDGTPLRMFLVHRKGLALDGSNPTYLYGYGGFNISMTPRFSVPNLVWVERGGIFAQAVLRGGGEFGAEWHEAGMLENKQNVFDDFVASAEYLIRNDYTSPEKLAIGGGSNGGLLVGATLNQRPELFGAAIPQVGVMDMLRYHEFTIGWAWASEYGRSDDASMFPVLYSYSPLHNVRSDVVYPPTMVMTGDHDDRVLPGHSYKYAAALQKAQPDAAILLRVQRKSGHGAGKPVAMRVREAADKWAFLDWALGSD